MPSKMINACALQNRYFSVCGSTKRIWKFNWFLLSLSVIIGIRDNRTGMKVPLNIVFYRHLLAFGSSNGKNQLNVNSQV